MLEAKVFKDGELSNWEVADINDADLLFAHHFEEECNFLKSALSSWQLKLEEHIIKRGGGLADQTKSLTDIFEKQGWKKNNIAIQKRISFQHTYGDIVSQNSNTHEIDHLIENNKGKKIALEIEWNNKDEFFDRDFQAMRRLYEEGIIEGGIIITRGPSLEDQLESAIAQYFEHYGVNDFSDFELIKNRLVDEKGTEKFSFPTSAQRNDIQKQLDKGDVSFSMASAKVFKNNKFGGTTTNWRQLQKRIERRDALRTPILFLGIPAMQIDMSA